MSSSEILTIGSVPKYRGEYNKDTVYYANNQVTMYGCVFQSIGNNFSNTPPLTVASDKTISLTNTNLWKCIINNVDLYNATLSTNNINNRVIAIENSVDTIKSTAQTANNAAQSANKQATTALSIATTVQQNVNDLTKKVNSNQQKIQENTTAIEALQKNASPLSIICTTKTIAFEPNDNGEAALSIPIYIYDNSNEITDKATVSVAVYTPIQTGLITSWDGANIIASTDVPGKHIIDITATYQGKTTNTNLEVYLTLPTTVSIISEDMELELANNTTIDLPIMISVRNIENKATQLLFNTPAYLNAERITCNGIDVPTTSDAETKNNYLTFRTLEKIVAGTYDFIIQ